MPRRPAIEPASPTLTVERLEREEAERRVRLKQLFHKVVCFSLADLANELGKKPTPEALAARWAEMFVALGREIRAAGLVRRVREVKDRAITWHEKQAALWLYTASQPQKLGSIIVPWIAREEKDHDRIRICLLRVMKDVLPDAAPDPPDGQAGIPDLAQGAVASETTPAAPAGRADTLEAMRAAIKNRKHGRNQKATNLIREAGVRNQDGYKALRELEGLGEYEGFSRKKKCRRK